MELLEKIKKAQEQSRKRKFKQTWDLIITLSGIDLKRPENRFNLELQLPAGRGKEPSICAITDTLTAEAKKLKGITVVTKAELASVAGDKKKLKKLVNEHDWFLGEISLMADIGKTMGAVLGTRGKMPKPIPPKIPVQAIVMATKKSIRVSLKTMPMIQVPVGTDDMSPEDIEKNISAVYNFVRERLPKGVGNIKQVMLKLTMGKPVKLEMRG